MAAIFHDGPKPKAAPFKNITGAEAARLIADSPHQPYNFVGLDATEAARLGVKAGDTVSVVPTDSGWHLCFNWKSALLINDVARCP
jgi:hypothetical protein